jgi:protein-S-isoprenylcysteine O-methyltransferase Ste14
MPQAAQTLAWLVAIVYATIPLFWLIVHPFASHWRKRRKPLPLVVLLWCAMWIIAGLLTARWRHSALYRHPAAWVAGALLILIAVWIYRRAHPSLSSAQVIGRAELAPHRHEQRLSTEGIRGRIRHPLYLAHLCVLLGLTIAFGTIALYSLAAFAVVTGIFMVRLEDRELEQRFGDEFLQYKRRVPAILPRF